MTAQLDPEQQAAAAMAVFRSLVREQQLLEAVAPLDELLSGHELEPVGHQLGAHLADVRADLMQLGQSFVPVVAAAAAGATPTSDGD